MSYPVYHTEPVDMFADVEEPTSSSAEESSASKLDEVSWEYKWENKEEADVHGPFTSTQMAQWSENG